MSAVEPAPSRREAELLERAYAYVLQHGLAELSLRPLAAAIGSSPRVLLFLFGNKEGLVRALLARARADELALLDQLRAASDGTPIGLRLAGERIWSWLSTAEHRPVLALWTEGYARSVVDPAGRWAGFAQSTVYDWLDVLASAQPPSDRHSPAVMTGPTLVLSVLRGAMLDLIATGDVDRITAAVRRQLESLDVSSPAPSAPGG